MNFLECEGCSIHYNFSLDADEFKELRIFFLRYRLIIYKEISFDTFKTSRIFVEEIQFRTLKQMQIESSSNLWLSIEETSLKLLSNIRWRWNLKVVTKKIDKNEIKWISRIEGRNSDTRKRRWVWGGWILKWPFFLLQSICVWQKKRFAFLILLFDDFKIRIVEFTLRFYKNLSIIFK